MYQFEVQTKDTGSVQRDKTNALTLWIEQVSFSHFFGPNIFYQFFTSCSKFNSDAINFVQDFYIKLKNSITYETGEIRTHAGSSFFDTWCNLTQPSDALPSQNFGIILSQCKALAWAWTVPFRNLISCTIYKVTSGAEYQKQIPSIKFNQ